MANGKEQEIQTAALEILRNHPKVAFAYVNTSGKVKAKGYWMTLGVTGLPDITFMTKDGRYGCVEVKQPGVHPTDEQYSFIKKVRKNGGIAGWINNAGQIFDILS